MMDKTTEVLIRKLLKGWVSQYHPPQNGRARLLWQASRQSRNQSQYSLLRSGELKDNGAFHSNEWSHTLFRWIIENTEHNGIQARVC
jgi:hypothetical protein